jgi:hypothetical protein
MHIPAASTINPNQSRNETEVIGPIKIQLTTNTIVPHTPSHIATDLRAAI